MFQKIEVVALEVVDLFSQSGNYCLLRNCLVLYNQIADNIKIKTSERSCYHYLISTFHEIILKQIITFQLIMLCINKFHLLHKFTKSIGYKNNCINLKTKITHTDELYIGFLQHTDDFKNAFLYGQNLSFEKNIRRLHILPNLIGI